MASASDYLETRILDYWLKANSLSTTPPNPIYIALFTADPTDSAGLTDFQDEVSDSGTAYQRTAVTFGTIDTQAGSVQNNAAVTFPVATAGYGTVTHIAIVDSPTYQSGNILFHGILDDDKLIEVNDTFQIATGSLTVTIA